MLAILTGVRFSVKEKLCKSLQRCQIAAVRIRYLIMINLLSNRSAYETAEVLGVHNTTVYRVARRFRAHGEWSLWDGREDNGQTKLDERFLTVLYRVVRATPQQYGWRRPTWTRESLVETLARQTGVRIHVTTMSRALAMIKARRGRPRPTVNCPWAKAAKTRRLNVIRRLLATLPRGQVAVYEDEVDIHLNPKIGLDWMLRGQQKEVLTPGQNVKRYLAGALDARAVAVGRRRAQDECFVYHSLGPVAANLCPSTGYPCDSRQLPHSRQQNRSCRPGWFWRAYSTPFSAALLPQRQQD